MARQSKRLTARSALALAKPGRHADGDGLYLVVDKSGAKRWVYLFRFGGRTKEMGLGSFGSVSLAKARELAQRARENRVDGVNPIEARKAASTVPTFGAMADELLSSKEPEWRNEKHRAQWRMTLTKYAAPLREMHVDAITTDDVLRVLKPLWAAKPETASRLRGRIERVLDAAKSRGKRSGENPALWRGHLENLLPKRQKLSRGHHAAMPYGDVPAFFAKLRAMESISAAALQFCILCAARSGEVLGARRSELNLEAGVWTIPAGRMKAGREHRVPLSAAAAAIARSLSTTTDDDGDTFVFPGQRPGRPLSVMALAMVLRRMKLENVTVHGFRSAFRDWAGECTEFPREIAEIALAHQVGDETERAYRRGDALDRRRALMDAWAKFALGAAG